MQWTKEVEEVAEQDPYETKDEEFGKLSLEERKAIIGEDLNHPKNDVQKNKKNVNEKIKEFEINEITEFIVSFLESSLPSISEENVLAGYNIFIHGSIPLAMECGRGPVIDRIRKLNEKLYSENPTYQFIEDNYRKNLQTTTN